MRFFNNVKNKAIFLSAVIAIVLTLSGCTSRPVNTVVSNNSNINISNIESNSEHQSSMDAPLDISGNNTSVVKATVDRVVDGDTVEIILPSGEEVDTRLLLIDTPETKHPDLGVQKYGPEASEFAKSVLHQGDTVYFELDGKSKADKYGRYLGYLWYTCKEHNTLEMYNERVVEEGLARVGYIYDQTKHLNILLETQEVAKSKKLNIWSIPGYVTDKGYDMNKVDAKANDSTSSNDSSNTEDITVYANGGSSSSNIYHKASNSHGMKEFIKMTQSEAESKGYKPCSTCFR